jgi:hypothetical protein
MPGVDVERKRQAFADQLRIAVARRLENRAVGSRDPVAVALLLSEEKEIGIEAALPPLRKVELSGEQRAFADAINRKLTQVLRPEARAR